MLTGADAAIYTDIGDERYRNTIKLIAESPPYDDVYEVEISSGDTFELILWVDAKTHASLTFDGTDDFISTGFPDDGDYGVLTVYFTVSPIETYTVTYDANGGSDAPIDSNNYRYNDTVTVMSESPVKHGYKFVGWSTAQDGMVEYQYDDTFNINQVTVTDDIPLRDGYELMGWTSDRESTTIVLKGRHHFTMPASNVTLYAQWIQTEFVGEPVEVILTGIKYLYEYQAAGIQSAWYEGEANEFAPPYTDAEDENDDGDNNEDDDDDDNGGDIVNLRGTRFNAPVFTFASYTIPLDADNRPLVNPLSRLPSSRRETLMHLSSRLQPAQTRMAPRVPMNLREITMMAMMTAILKLRLTNRMNRKLMKRCLTSTKTAYPYPLSATAILTSSFNSRTAVIGK